MLKELKDFRHDAWQCFRDSICKQVFTWHTRDGVNFWQSCPSLAYKSFAAYSGQGRFDLARGFIEGEIGWTPKLLEIIYLCQLDGHCEYNCGRVMELRPASTIQAFRAQAIKDGQTPPGGFKDFLAGLREYNNPYKKLDAERINWLKDLPTDNGKGKVIEAPTRTKTLLYVGCGVMRDISAQNLPRTAFKILQKAGVDVGILGDAERCCGNPALRVGDADTFLCLLYTS
ncbi:MAG: (Fe-S)-binding protein, partial [Dehalococcoidia bacterium]|nr:(Fe-S)-binding protein [Dehalococcoidia bacterium]